MQCIRCRQENPPQAKFCLECGQPLTARSPAQGRLRSPEAYTPRHLIEKILTSRSALEGERKQVTVLFCDIANSTALAERLGPDSMHHLLDQFFDLSLRAVHRYEGTINQFLGDGFMALFGAPIAYEDHARRAVLAALGIQRALDDHRAEMEPPGGGRLAVRIGLNTGLVVVGKIGDNLRMDYTAVGDTTHLAARLQQLAELGTIYLSANTYRAAQGHVECQALGTRTVKGRSEPVAVYKVLSVRTRAGATPSPEGRRVGAPLVGREREFAALLACIDRLRSGQGGLVSVTSEAGLGKSRLLAEVRRQAAGKGLLWVEGRALSFTRTVSYWPFMEIIRTYVGISEADSEPESWAKLERGVRVLFPDQVAEILPYLATLLSLEVRGDLQDRVRYLDGRAMGLQILFTSRRFFERLAAAQPLALVFEDLEWIDQSSVELIEHLLPLVETAPFLVCWVGRPAPSSPGARLAEIAAQKYAERYTEIALSPLSRAESADLLSSLLPIRDLSSRVQDLILDKSEGNPFFLEEVVRSLLDARAIIRDAGGGWRTTDRVEHVTIPDTLQGVILARIDQLAEDVKYVLKLAAVIGRSFFYRVLRAIAEAEAQLDQQLAQLQHVELIREKQSVPELEYIFKHGLVQEAAYESILVHRRRQLHRQVGESIEALFPNRLEEFHGLLAYHYAKAEEWAKAQTYLMKAGDQAGKFAADAEALVHYQEAFAACARVFGEAWDPQERAALERKIGGALFRQGDHQQALECLERALTYLGTPYPTSRLGVLLAIVKELARQAGHRFLPGIFLRRRGPQADAVAEERVQIYELRVWIDYFTNAERVVLDSLTLLNVSERAGALTGVARGSTAIGMICDLIPAFRLAESYHRRALVLAEQLQHPVVVGTALLGLGVHEYHVGKWQLGLDRFERAARLFQEAGDLHAWGLATQIVAWVLRLQGNLGRSLQRSHEIIRIGRDVGDKQVLGWGLHGLGWTLWHSGTPEEPVPCLQSALDLYKAVPDYPAVAEATSDLAACYLRQGRLREALALLEEANQLIQQRGLRGVVCTRPCNGLAEGYLRLAETEDRQRRAALRRAKRACRGAFRQCRIDRGGLIAASRLWGTYEWLRGRRRAARRWWERSLAVADELSARYETATTSLEMGRRLHDRAYLERAEAIFAEIGATADLALTRELLSRAAWR